MKDFAKTYNQTRNIIESGDSDPIEGDVISGIREPEGDNYPS